jgi:hypothetical protein
VWSRGLVGSKSGLADQVRRWACATATAGCPWCRTPAGSSSRSCARVGEPCDADATRVARCRQRVGRAGPTDPSLTGSLVWRLDRNARVPARSVVRSACSSRPVGAARCGPAPRPQAVPALRLGGPRAGEASGAELLAVRRDRGQPPQSCGYRRVVRHRPASWAEWSPGPEAMVCCRPDSTGLPCATHEPRSRKPHGGAPARPRRPDRRRKHRARTRHRVRQRADLLRSRGPPGPTRPAGRRR